MKLEVGKSYMRKDFKYSANITKIEGDDIHYLATDVKTNHTGKHVRVLSSFTYNYLTTDLLSALL